MHEQHSMKCLYSKKIMFIKKLNENYGTTCAEILFPKLLNLISKFTKKFHYLWQQSSQIFEV